jgi:hypothetical protein
MLDTFKGNFVKRFNVDEFYDFINILYEQNAIALTDSQIEGNEIIFAVAGNIKMGEMTLPVICINNNAFDSVDDDMQEAILAHESAHCKGIMNEEDADRWALKNINENAQQVLISLWKERHGMEYYRK